jgi:hypothetical protein
MVGPGRALRGHHVAKCRRFISGNVRMSSVGSIGSQPYPLTTSMPSALAQAAKPAADGDGDNDGSPSGMSGTAGTSNSQRILDLTA